MTIELLNMDCMEYMKDQPDNSFDLAIVDPPYGIDAGKQSNKSKYVTQKNGNKIYLEDGGYEHKDWDSKPASPEYFKELKRVSKNQIIFGVNYYIDIPLGAGRIVWDKLNDHSDQSDCEIAYCSYNNRVDIVRYLWAGFMQGQMASKSIKESITQIGNKKLNESRIHPTQKPVKLYNWIIRNYAQTSDRILDTHLGSGSSAIAAHDPLRYFYSDRLTNTNRYIEQKQKITRLRPDNSSLIRTVVITTYPGRYPYAGVTTA